MRLSALCKCAWCWDGLGLKNREKKNGKEWCVKSRHTVNKKHLGLQSRWSVVALLCEKKQRKERGGDLVVSNTIGGHAVL